MTLQVLPPQDLIRKTIIEVVELARKRDARRARVCWQD